MFYKVIVTRCERILIRKNHPKFKIIDEMCFASKNLYNYANYIIRQEFFKSGEYIPYRKMNYDLKTHQQYKDCMSQPANCVLRLLDKNWKSFFKGIKEWAKHPDKFLGKPKPPGYLPKDGRYNWMIPNNVCYYGDNKICFHMKKLSDYKWRSRCLGRLIQVRFVPVNKNYFMEIIYQIEVDNKEIMNVDNRIISIDLGVNNFAAITNNIGLSPFIINGRQLKSINQFYNKRRAKEQFIIRKRNNQYWSNKLDKITLKRNNRISNFMHHASRYIINFCVENKVNIIVVGHNKFWKQNVNLGHINNQNFTSIPYNLFIEQLKSKAEIIGIQVIETEENYTSGTSYLDDEMPTEDNYNIKRRRPYGLFQSSKMIVNADVNGSLQIMKKVFPDSKTGYGTEVDLTPTIINVI